MEEEKKEEKGEEEKKEEEKEQKGKKEEKKEGKGKDNETKRVQQNITPNILPVGVQNMSVLKFYFEGKTQSLDTPKPYAYCDHLMLLENNRRSVVGAPKINPSLGKACDSTDGKQKFLKTTRYNPSSCTKSCPKLLTGTKENNGDQKIENCVTEGNNRKGTPVGFDKGAALMKGQELSKKLGFIENTGENFSSKVGNSTTVTHCKVGVPSGLTIHPGIYSSQQPAFKNKPNQPRAVEKKMPKKCSLLYRNIRKVN